MWQLKRASAGVLWRIKFQPKRERTPEERARGATEDALGDPAEVTVFAGPDAQEALEVLSAAIRDCSQEWEEEFDAEGNPVVTNFTGLRLLSIKAVATVNLTK
jgi:hypothetical protein